MLQDLPENASLGKRAVHFFRERQVYLRSDGQVHFVAIRPWVQVCAVLFMLIASCWIVFATVNVAFKDQIIAAKKLKYHRMQSAYEDQLAAMSSNVNQLNGRLLLNQDAYEAKLGSFRKRQITLKDRQDRIEALMHRGFGFNLSGLGNTSIFTPPSLKAMKTGNNSDKLQLVFKQRDLVRPQSRKIPKKQNHTRVLRKTNTILSIDEELQRMRKNLQITSDEQTRVLMSLERESARQKRRYSKIMASLGFNAQRMAQKGRPENSGVGGPFVKLSEGMDYARNEDEERVERINTNLTQAAVLRRELSTMPIGLPLKIALRVTSRFGPRRDPFRKVAAMHTGIDYGGQAGVPVFSTAKGKIVRAGWLGGYGRVVEILHAHGIITRYAHLSRIDVSIGDGVKRGERIGRVGNSGRSTSAHLHYETRVSGKAVNPNRFMQAGFHVFKKKEATR